MEGVSWQVVQLISRRQVGENDEFISQRNKLEVEVFIKKRSKERQYS